MFNFTIKIANQRTMTFVLNSGIQYRNRFHQMIYTIIKVFYQLTLIWKQLSRIINVFRQISCHVQLLTGFLCLILFCFVCYIFTCSGISRLSTEAVPQRIPSLPSAIFPQRIFDSKNRFSERMTFSCQVQLTLKQPALL